MRALLIIIGALAGLAGLYCAASGYTTFQAVDSDGFITSDRATIVSDALAVTVDAEEIETQSKNLTSGQALIRVEARREDGGPVFVGIGKADLVQAYLLGSRHEALTDIEFDPLRYNARTIAGRSTPDLLTPPESRGDIWDASSAGEGLQETSYAVLKDDEGKVIPHTVVIMNADPSSGIAVEAELGVKYPRLRGTGIVFMIIGTFVFLLGALMVVVAWRSGGGDDEDAEPEPLPEREPPLFG